MSYNFPTSSVSSTSNIRYRSGSVERSRMTSTSSGRDPAPYRTSYGHERGRSREIPTARMSRATSYDPFSSSSTPNRASSVIRSSTLSSSDYSSTQRNTSSFTNRYGSTEQLNNSYRPTYRSGSTISSGSAASSSTNSYVPRNVRAGSVGIGAFDPPRTGNSNDLVASSLSRYRPNIDSSSSYTPSISRYRSTDLSNTSDYSTSKYRSPDNSYNSTRCSSMVSNRYSTSNTSPYSSRTSTSSSYRTERDYRSMSRTDNEGEEVDEVENTFRKLYRKYVTDSEPDLTKKEPSLAEEVSRRFESRVNTLKTEANEEENSDLSISEEDEDEEDVLTKYRVKGGLRRASSASSLTPRASVCNSPSKDLTPKCSPLLTRKEMRSTAKSSSRSVSPELKPLRKDFQMEETIGVSCFKKEQKEEVTSSEDVLKTSEEVTMGLKEMIKAENVENKEEEEENEENEEEEEGKSGAPDNDDVVTKSENLLKRIDDIRKSIKTTSKIDDLATPEEPQEVVSATIPKDVVNFEKVKKVAACIKINGIPVKEEEAEKTEEKVAVRIRIRSDKSPSRVKEQTVLEEVPVVQSPEKLILTAANVVLHKEEKDENSFEKEKSSESDTSSSRASSIRRRRDPNRTLENLQTILKAEKMKETSSEENSSEEKSPTEKCGNSEKKMRNIPIPLVLITEPSNPSTPLATTPVTTAASICLWNKRTSSSSEGDNDEDEEEYEDEDEYSSGDWTEGEDDEEYLTDEEDEEFSVSQTFSLKDHINLKDLYPLTNSASNTSALVSEFSDGDTFLADTLKEESRGRVDRLFAVPAPTFTCSVTYDGMLPDDDDEWSDEVHSCEEGDDEDFRVLPIARPGSSSLGAYMSPGSMTSESNDEDYDGRTVGCTLKLVDRAARKDSGEDSEESEYYDDEEEDVDDEEYEEYWDEEIEYEDEEEYEEDEEEEEEEEEVLEEYMDEEEEETMKSVESSEEEDVEESMHEELFVTPMKLMTESLVEEMIEEACIGEIPEETLFALDGVEVEDYIGQKDVQMVPTFVQQMTENIREESTSRFAADRKPVTDFAKKAVIQPTKLEKVQVGSKIDTKLAPSEEEKMKMKKEEEERKKQEKEEEMRMKKEKEEEEKKRKELLERKKKDAEEGKKQEDKSALRKSALNMKEEDAKKKVATDEKAAAQKARRFGTVSAMAGKFDESIPEESVTITTKKKEPLYKKSSRLESNESEKPKRTYQVIKPVINDDFDKQMEEIRKQMKSGSNELQNKMKILSKGILTATEEAKIRELEEKRRVTNEKATSSFGKAEEEKARWKANRDAETALEYAKIEAEKHLKKKRILIDKPSGETVLNQEKIEPKRTIRRWKPPPPDPNAIIPSFSCGPKEPVKPKIVPSSTTDSTPSKPSTPTARRKVTSSPTVTRKSTASPIPKGDGAAATRIRNAASVQQQVLSSTVPSTVPGDITSTTVASTVGTVIPEAKPVSKRYSSRRKTQEIVNESVVEPKSKKRKLKPRKTKFTRTEKDADIMLGFAKNLTFEQLERLFDQSSRDRRPVQKWEKVKRLAPSKVFISDLTDIDKIYKSSEIRDIIASVNLIY